MSLLALTADVYSRSHRYLEGGPGHFFMYVFGRFRPVRAFMVWRYSRRSAPALPIDRPVQVGTTESNLAATVDVNKVASDLQRDGVSTGLTLRHDTVQELLSYASVATCYGDAKPENAFRYGDYDGTVRPFRLGRYTNALHSCRALQSLAADPQLVAIARKYLGSEPVLIGARMWWSLAGPADELQKKRAGQGFHYDIDGYRGLTFFFYLTDVGPSSGPHLYVRGTHKRKALKHLVSLHKAQSDEEVEARYGVDRQIVLCGPAGSGFAEDIFGYHKGLPPDEDRLIAQVRFGLHDYGTTKGD
jgi:hypothetical protein